MTGVVRACDNVAQCGRRAVLEGRLAWVVWLSLGLLCWAPSAYGAQFYVDPENGDISNDGSAQSPWSTIQEVIEADLIQSQAWAELPYAEGAELVVSNAEAPVQPGDTIWLRSGYHGELFIQGAYNEQTITIAAEADHHPQVSSIHLRAGAHWVIRGLEVSAEFAPSYEVGTLVHLESHSHQGPPR